MGAIEEGGKAVSNITDALKGSPVLIIQALIIAGIVFILYVQGTRSFDERERLLKSVFESQSNVREILAKCIVPQQRQTVVPPEQQQAGKQQLQQTEPGVQPRPESQPNAGQLWVCTPDNPCR